MRKVVNELKHRKIEEKHYKTICKYLNNEIDWLTAHNILIGLGINLTSTGSLLDY